MTPILQKENFIMVKELPEGDNLTDQSNQPKIDKIEN